MNIIELVKKAQNGDQAAFMTLFEQYEQDIYRIAYVYLNHQEDAMDVVQETAYRSFKAISRIKEPHYFKTWLIRIAITSSLDSLRKRKKTLRLAPDFGEWLETGEEAEDIPLSITLKDLIDSLDEEEKQVIVLRFYQDYTIKETAEIAEIPLGTAKTILYRALSKLRKRAKEDDLHDQYR
ncbi:RNA polymerase sigma factor [Paenibacillus sp. MBLB4367]|uniref:RNA polymerase sigma factor n=1 Tax=Paenibacillus sp. MBLB4367 TaxID=3384767 RepID=UPI003907F14A